MELDDETLEDLLLLLLADGEGQTAEGADSRACGDG
jgi:hypothetical protein